MAEGLSIAALVVALIVGGWQWRVMGELKQIRQQLEHIRYGNGDDDA